MIWLSVRAHAVGYIPDQVLAPCQACWRALEFPRRECARPWSDEWTPSDREGDPRRQNDRQHGEHPPQRLSKPVHPRNLLRAEPE